jgi:hypothetical protein
MEDEDGTIRTGVVLAAAQEPLADRAAGRGRGGGERQGR